MKEKTSHREILLDTALTISLEKGYHATRVDEVCSAAGVTKGSFYHHFDSKDHLACELVDHYFSPLAEKLAAGDWVDIHDPTQKLFGFLDHVIHVVRGPMLKRGCLLGSFALDLSATHPQIRSLIEDRLEQLAQVLVPLIDDAAAQQDHTLNLSPQILAHQFVAVIQGAIVMAKAYENHDQVQQSVMCYRNMLQGVLNAH